MSVDLHFLNVGAGDCTIVHFPERHRQSDGKTQSERVMMVDICHHDDHEEYENVIDYFKTHFRNSDGSLKSIFRLVCTHPHHDHIFGLKQLLDDSEISIANFWNVEHSFEPDDFSGHESHKQDWDAYQTLATSDGSPKVIRTFRADPPREFWNDDEDRITVLVPSKDLQKHARYKEDGTKRNKADVEIDEISYMISIKVNTRKILLAGDGRDTPAWDSVYDNCYSDIGNITVLKAGHHGHQSAFHEEAVKRMNPDYVIFSNGKSEDDENGADADYRNVLPDSEILKTCDHGTIVMHIPFGSDEDITYEFR